MTYKGYLVLFAGMILMGFEGARAGAPACPPPVGNSKVAPLRLVTHQVAASNSFMEKVRRCQAREESISQLCNDSVEFVTHTNPSCSQQNLKMSKQCWEGLSVDIPLCIKKVTGSRGKVQVRHMGIEQDRLSASGCVSIHALRRAIDIAAIEIDGKVYDYKRASNRTKATDTFEPTEEWERFWLPLQECLYNDANASQFIGTIDWQRDRELGTNGKHFDHLHVSCGPPDWMFTEESVGWDTAATCEGLKFCNE